MFKSCNLQEDTGVSRTLPASQGSNNITILKLSNSKPNKENAKQSNTQRVRGRGWGEFKSHICFTLQTTINPFILLQVTFNVWFVCIFALSQPPRVSPFFCE